MPSRKVTGENMREGIDVALLLVGLLLILYGVYCVMLAVAYGPSSLGYFLFYLFIAFVFVFIAKGIISWRRLFMIVGFSFFIMYVLFVVVALIFYEEDMSSVVVLILLFMNSAAALILFIKLGWYRKFMK